MPEKTKDTNTAERLDPVETVREAVDNVLAKSQGEEQTDMTGDVIAMTVTHRVSFKQKGRTREVLLPAGMQLAVVKDDTNRVQVNKISRQITVQKADLLVDEGVAEYV